MTFCQYDNKHYVLSCSSSVFLEIHVSQPTVVNWESVLKAEMFRNYLLTLILVFWNSGYTQTGLIDSPNKESKDSTIKSNGTTGGELEEPILQDKINSRLLASIAGFMGIGIGGEAGAKFAYSKGTNRACCVDGTMGCCVDGSVGIHTQCCASTTINMETSVGGSAGINKTIGGNINIGKSCE
ncbi:unnamed protein product [Nezara viridula]|uniref:Uncharacterized protein n=1 Tax=Nezara viridula TaxID=85310 RepID=A0A9P0HH47_NEZVI|nr:unnamed protein product [Nezara viridula]